MHNDLPGQETEDRLACTAPGGLAGLCAVQADPFHVSAAGGPPCGWVPTATHAEAAAQATPVRLAPRSAAGVFSAIQARPFHRCALGPPTAWHSRARGHAAAVRNRPAGEPA